MKASKQHKMGVSIRWLSVEDDFFWTAPWIMIRGETCLWKWRCPFWDGRPGWIDSKGTPQSPPTLLFVRFLLCPLRNDVWNSSGQEVPSRWQLAPRSSKGLIKLRVTPHQGRLSIYFLYLMYLYLALHGGCQF